MSTLLPRDVDNNTIPALRLRSGGAHSINATATSARNSTAFNAATRIISLYASVPVFLALGDNSVTATSNDHYFPAGVYYDIAIGGDKVDQHTHIAVLRADADGTVYISEKV